MSRTISSLSHTDSDGNPRMVDISEKCVSARRARAEATVLFPPEVFAQLRAGQWQSAKGSVLHTAIIAGTQAVKRTWDLIPFCHPLPIDGCRVELRENPESLQVSCEVKTTHKTGVEMEALTGAAIAALTVVDMCKALSPAIRITDLRLREKSGGKADIQLP